MIFPSEKKSGSWEQTKVHARLARKSSDYRTCGFSGFKRILNILLKEIQKPHAFPNPETFALQTFI